MINSSHSNSSDIIEYQILGDDLQFIKCKLDPEEAMIGEAGAMMFMDQGLQMKTIFGDGSSDSKGVLGKLWQASSRLLAGESLFITMFENKVDQVQELAFASPFPGKIIDIDLKKHSNEILCQRDSFLCAAKGVSIGIGFQKKIMTGLFGGEGFILQKLKGDGMAFLNCGGAVYQRELREGEVLKIDTGCIVAFESSVDYSIEMIKGISSMVFGGEGLFLATLRGPGKIYLQSMPFSTLAAQILSRATGANLNKSTHSKSIGGLNSIASLFENK